MPWTVTKFGLRQEELKYPAFSFACIESGSEKEKGGSLEKEEESAQWENLSATHPCEQLSITHLDVTRYPKVVSIFNVSGLQQLWNSVAQAV